MKTRQIFLFFLITVFTFSCTPVKKKFQVEGVAPADQDSSWVYLKDYETQAVLDSIQLIDGKFSLTGVADPFTYYSVEISKYLTSDFIPEEGIIIVDLSKPQEIGGTPLNDRFAEFQKEEEEAYQNIRSKVRELRVTHEGDEEGFEAAVKGLLDENKASFEKYIIDNANNGLGKYALLRVYGMFSPDEIEKMYSQLGENVKNSSMIQNIMRLTRAKVQTEEGKMFTDFTIENGNADNSSVSLSDYVGKGKYVLVDFWASWCGPCIRETPVIAEVYNKYKGDKFEVLGVAVWEEDRKNTLEAIEAHGIVWPQILDAKSIPTELYAIEGIPHIILFGPDGTILARGLRGEQLKAKVEEFMQQ